MLTQLATFSLIKDAQTRSQKTHLLTDDELHIVQSALLSMMDDIHKFCEKYQITYVLGGGTALGAIRHKGFIPWDDDIDIFMPRSDYERFREMFSSEQSDNYYVQDIYSDTLYNSNLMKVRKKNTVYRELIDPNPDKVGLFIDVYSIENTYNNKLLRRFHSLLTDGLQFICSCIRIRSIQKTLFPLMNKEEQKIIKYKIRIGYLFSFFSIRKWLFITDKTLKMYGNNKSRFITVPLSATHFDGELCERSDYFPPRLLEFEGRKYWGMNKVEKYLKSHYGNFMRLPAENDRERHAIMEINISK